jgi:hypothetical protein
MGDHLDIEVVVVGDWSQRPEGSALGDLERVPCEGRVKIGCDGSIPAASVHQHVGKFL